MLFKLGKKVMGDHHDCYLLNFFSTQSHCCRTLTKLKKQEKSKPTMKRKN